MKTFLSTNWYKLTTAIAMLLFAFGFSVFALKYNTAKAGTPAAAPFSGKDQTTQQWMVGIGNSIYEVTYNSDEYPKFKKYLLFKIPQ